MTSNTFVSTAAIADASVRLGITVQASPHVLVPLVAGSTFSGPARPVTHLGSVDVLLETIDDAPTGSVLVVDNGARTDEACVGDLMVLEAKLAGLSGMVIWGLHRDTAQLLQIGLPVFSLGSFPLGPRRVPPAGRTMRSATIDGIPVTEADYLVGDDDGILIFAADRKDELFGVALSIQETEGGQAERMRGGASLRAQLDFASYREKQSADPSITLRKHLLDRGNSIEV
jgi:4-hydroxy-4-methyl-2-oxoglutarate aldolase